jgi:hypothetical protein
LDLDERTAVVHDDIHVGFGLGVFRVVEIQHRDAADNTNRNGGHLSMQRVRRDQAALHQRFACSSHGDVAAGYGGRPRSAVRLQDVAVDSDGALAEGF